MSKFIRSLLVALFAIMAVASPSATRAAGVTTTTITNQVATSRTGFESVCYGWAHGAGSVTTTTSGTITDYGTKQVYVLSGTFTATGLAATNAAYTGTFTDRFTVQGGKKVQTDVRATYKGGDSVQRSFRVWGNDAAGMLNPKVTCS